MRAALLLFAALTVNVAKAKPLPYFFEISRHGHVSYVLGTIHSGTTLNDLHPLARRTLLKSRVLLMEWKFPRRVVRWAQGDPWMFRQKTIALFTPTVPRSQQLPSPETLEKLRELGLPERYLPLVRDDMCELAHRTRDTFAELKIMDMDILRVAYQKKIPIKQLDRPELAEETRRQLKENRCSLNEFLADKTAEGILAKEQARTQAYLRDDLGSELHPEDDPETFARRNRIWLDKISTFAEAGGAFIAVGAGHLIGREGLKSLLEAQGFQFRKIDPASP